MRTKTLVLSVALGVVGMVGTFAQVYSVNVVGYVNVTLYPGYNLIANPLMGASTKISALITAPIDGMGVFKYDNVNQTYTGGTANYIEAISAWDNDFDVAPGDGMFVLLPGTANKTITFVGEVLTGTQTIQMAGGIGKFNMVSSKIPQAGKLVTDLGFPVADGDNIFLYDPMHDGTGYSKGTYNYIEAIGGWDNGEPVVQVGQAFFAAKAANATWTRTFTVN